MEGASMTLHPTRIPIEPPCSSSSHLCSQSSQEALYHTLQPLHATMPFCVASSVWPKSESNFTLVARPTYLNSTLNGSNKTALSLTTNHVLHTGEELDNQFRQSGFALLLRATFQQSAECHHILGASTRPQNPPPRDFCKPFLVL